MCNLSPSCATSLIKYRKVHASTTGGYVSPKSILGICENPWATSRAFYLTISPFSFHFHTKTHLYPTGFTPSGVQTIGPKTFLS